MTDEATEIEEEFDTEPEQDTDAPTEDANALISLAQDQVLATGKIAEETLEKLKQIEGVTDDTIEDAVAKWRASAFDPSHIKFDDTFTKAQLKKALDWADKSKDGLSVIGLRESLRNKKVADSTARQLYAEFVSETVANKPYKLNEKGSLKYKGDDLGLEARGRAPAIKQSSTGYDWDPRTPMTEFLKDEGVLYKFGIKTDYTQSDEKLKANREAIQYDKDVYGKEMGKLLDTVEKIAKSREYKAESRAVRRNADNDIYHRLAVQLSNPQKFFR